MYSSMYFLQNLGVLFIQMKTNIGDRDFSRKLFTALARLRRRERGKSVAEEETVEIARAKGDLINLKTEKGDERERVGCMAAIGHLRLPPIRRAASRSRLTHRRDVQSELERR